MDKRTFNTLLVTILIVVAVAAVVIPGKIAQYQEQKAAAIEQARPKAMEILCKEETDGSFIYLVPFTYTDVSTGEKQMQYFTVSSRELPAEIQVNGEKYIFEIDAEGKGSFTAAEGE